MKKVLPFLIIIVISVLALSGCTKDSVPGSMWASKEVVTYTAKEDNKAVGTLTIKVTRHNRGEFDFAKLDKKINIKNSTTKGTFIETTYIDIEGESILVNQVLMDGFNMAASYRWEKRENDIIETIYIYGIKTIDYNIIKNGENSKSGSIKFKAKSGSILDGGAIYTYFRCHNIDNTKFSASFQVPDATIGKMQIYNFASVAEEKVDGIPFLQADEAISVDCIKTRISRTTSPIGAPIFINYAKNIDTYRSIDDNPSARIPVRIVENNITYTLSSKIIG